MPHPSGLWLQEVCGIPICSRTLHSPTWELGGLDGTGSDPDRPWQDPGTASWGSGEGGREALWELGWPICPSVGRW